MEAATVEIRRSRGKLIVQATGRTARGQRYIKGSVPLTVKSMADPNFKREMAAAVEQLLDSGA